MASIRPRKNKAGKITSYQIRVYKGRDELGNQLKPYLLNWKVPEGLTEKQIQKQLNKVVVSFENQCNQGFDLDNRQTFSSYANYVISLKERNGLKHKTIVRYKELLIRINEAIGHLKLKDIKPQHLNEFYVKLGQEGQRKTQDQAVLKADISEALTTQALSRAKLATLAGVSPSTVTAIMQGKIVSYESAQKVSKALGSDVKKLFSIQTGTSTLSNKTILEHHRLISTILAQAEKEMLIVYNPAAKAAPPKIQYKEANYFSNEDIVRIRESLENEPLKWKLAIHLLLITGCRRGEILGLKWDKIDWEQNQIYVCNNLLYTKDRGIYEDTTKTIQSNRYIKLPVETMELLARYKDTCHDKATALCREFREDDFIFTQDNGGPMSPDSLTDYCNKFSKKYNLPHINPHAFRHTHISLLILNGVDIITTSRRAGHSKITTTINTYSHVMKKADEMASECIADVILRDKKKNA